MVIDLIQDLLKMFEMTMNLSRVSDAESVWRWKQECPDIWIIMDEK